MNQRIKHKLICLFLGLSFHLTALDIDEKKVIIVPFETQNNFIIVELVLQRKLPLKFIFDTGAESTIITKQEIADVLGFQYDKRFQIIGADLSQTMYANRVKDASIFLEGMDVSQQKILVLEEDYFNFEGYLGMSIHGVMGMDFLKNYVVDIDYRRRLLTFTPADLFKKPKQKFEEFAIQVSKNKPYLNTKIKINQDTTLDLVFLLDTGASVSALIHNNTHPDLKIPNKTIKGNLGMGLGGALEGYIGILPSFSFGSFEFQELIVNYMEINEYQAKNKVMKYNGLIGNLLLSRFHVIIDFPNRKLYLKPVKKYDKAFQYDKSGLSVIAASKKLNRFFVQKPIENSPANIAEIQLGDEIVRLNGLPWHLLSLDKINSVLSKKEGKRINMVIKRKGKRMKKQFTLRKLL